MHPAQIVCCSLQRTVYIRAAAPISIFVIFLCLQQNQESPTVFVSVSLVITRSDASLCTLAKLSEEPFMLCLGSIY